MIPDDDDEMTTYYCAYCGEKNETFVDPTGGERQTYTKDCAVCCRPNVIRAEIDPDGNIRLTAEFEG